MGSILSIDDNDEMVVKSVDLIKENSAQKSNIVDYENRNINNSEILKVLTFVDVDFNDD